MKNIKHNQQHGRYGANLLTPDVFLLSQTMFDSLISIDNYTQNVKYRFQEMFTNHFDYNPFLQKVKNNFDNYNFDIRQTSQKENKSFITSNPNIVVCYDEVEYAFSLSNRSNEQDNPSYVMELDINATFSHSFQDIFQKTLNNNFWILADYYNEKLFHMKSNKVHRESGPAIVTEYDLIYLQNGKPHAATSPAYYGKLQRPSFKESYNIFSNKNSQYPDPIETCFYVVGFAYNGQNFSTKMFELLHNEYIEINDRLEPLTDSDNMYLTLKL